MLTDWWVQLIGRIEMRSEHLPYHSSSSFDRETAIAPAPVPQLQAALFPGALITAAVLSFHFYGEGVLDLFDMRSRSR